jgi:hypothetical protein
VANSSISSLDLISLDFDGLKTDLKRFMKSQSQFKDYDFESSAMSVLLDVLVYNTTKNIFFYNMDISESFLDSAQMRDSVLSRAKDLNYTPRSARSAKARVAVSFKATGESQPYVISKGSGFGTVIKNESFFFTIPETLTVASANTSFSFETDIYEGVYIKDTYIFPSNVDNKRFRINNKNVDTNSLSVVAFEDNTLVGQKYTRATTLLGLNELSKVYFLQASENGYYEILFGDNNIGRQPKAGSTIVLDYRVSTGSKANGAKSFTQNFDPTGEVSELIDNVVVETLSNGINGSEPESIDSIKYYAPRHFQVQERAIVPSDYEVILKEEFPEINAVSAYGGEDANPPQYGKVFIAVDLKDVEGFPQSKVEEYTDFIKKRTMLDPIFIEPVFTYFRIDSTVRYNINVTTLSPKNLGTLVSNVITAYNDAYLDDFAVEFRRSPFTTAIDDSDQSMISNVTRVSLYKKFNPELQVFTDAILDFGVKLENLQQIDIDDDNDLHTLSSTYFTFKGMRAIIKDDGAGGLWITHSDSGIDKKIAKVGSVDYDSGVVNIESFYCDSYEGSTIKLYVIPADDDIIIPRDTIASIEPDEIHLTVETLKR